MQLGCTAVKVTVGAGSPQLDASRLAAVREVVGDDTLLVVDAFRTFRGLEDALHRLRLLEPYDLSYVEDPFSETAAPLVRDLRRRSGMSIGLGENLTGHRAFRDLLDADAVDVVRCDATVAGGVRELMAATALASARALPVSMHVHANVHVHFGAALSNLHPAGLEYMPPDSGLDALETLLDEPLEIRDGRAVLPDQPGLGLDLELGHRRQVRQWIAPGAVHPSRASRLVDAGTGSGPFSFPWDAPLVPPFPLGFRDVSILTVAWRTDRAASSGCSHLRWSPWGTSFWPTSTGCPTRTSSVRLSSAT